MYDESFGHEEDYVPLSRRRQIVALNKIDSVSEERLRDLTAQFQNLGCEVQGISAVCGHGIKELIYDIGRLALENKKEAAH
jgi:GTPase involved in cell partitioning and DNA repair